MWPVRGVLAPCWGDGVKFYDGALEPDIEGAVMKAGDYSTCYQVKHFVVRKNVCACPCCHTCHMISHFLRLCYSSGKQPLSTYHYGVSLIPEMRKTLPLHQGLVVHLLHHVLLQREIAVYLTIHLSSITSFSNDRTKCTTRSQTSGKSRPNRSSPRHNQNR